MPRGPRCICSHRADDHRLAKAEVYENVISSAILDSAIEVHRTLGGPGLLESVYEEALAYELGLWDPPGPSRTTPLHPVLASSLRPVRQE